MRRHSWSALVALICCAAPALLRPAAAQVPRPLDIGGPPGDTTVRRCATDSVVTAALAAFNSPAAVRFWTGGGSVGPGVTTVGTVGAYRGPLKIDGTVQGDVVVLNGYLRVGRTGRVTGRVTVIGGSITLDQGGSISGPRFECDQPVPLARFADNTLGRALPTPSIGGLRSAMTWSAGDFTFTPHLGITSYNRSEGIPIQIGINAYRTLGADDHLRAEAYAIARTARDPSDSRPTIGWNGLLRYTHDGSIPFGLEFEAGSTVRATRDQPYSSLESSLSAVLLRRDYMDWYLNRGASVTATIRPVREVTVAGSIESSHQTTVLATDAFSLLRNADPWRPNPLIDDGRYRIVTGRLTWDARDEHEHPGFSWYAQGEIRHVTSDDLTPVSLPTSIRDPLPTSGYRSTEGQLDLRGFLRLDPEQRVSMRIAAGGYMSGDPLTIQNRRAMGGPDPMLGYGFRFLNCDRQRKAFASTPALCDRSMSVEGEYHRTLSLDIGTQVAGRNIGIRNPDLVLLGDIGSAWLAGDTPGRVPTNRIQALREWRSDIGAGITTGPIGLYVAKALADAVPLRFTLLFNARY